MLSIRMKLTLAFSLLSLLIMMQLGLFYYFGKREFQLIEGLVEEHQISRTLAELAISGQKIRRYEKEYFIYVDNEEKRAKYWGEWNDAQASLTETIKELKHLFSKPETANERQAVVDWERALGAYTLGFNNVNDAVKNQKISDTVSANLAIQAAKNRFKVLLSGTAKEVNNRFSMAKERADELRSNMDTVQTIFVGFSITSVIIAILNLALIPGAITKPIVKLTQIADQMSNGDIKNPSCSRG